MFLEILDVQHGACALIRTSCGRYVMVDCGDNTSTGWQPGTALLRRGITSLERLIITNYDEDHASGFTNLYANIAVSGLQRNGSVSAQIIHHLKKESYDTFEVQALKRFFNEGLPYLPPLPRSYSNDRILAQHFGVPTRLLDWSRDPLVATFFAVEDWQTDADAAIYMLHPNACHLPEEVRSLGPHQVIALTPPAIDRRIPAQKSMFTFHPYGPPDKPFVPLNERLMWEIRSQQLAALFAALR